jgi:hypothetical protein
MHLLHGVLHANGFGHLCRVNGREGGSSTLSGKQLMDAWDALCTTLRARTISVEDVSNKLTLELRVLHPLAYGHTWYGQWGYTFGRGPYDLSEAGWTAALGAARHAPLSPLLAAIGGAGSRRKGVKGLRTALLRYSGAAQEEATVAMVMDYILQCLRDPELARPLIVASGSVSQRPGEAPIPLEAPTRVKVEGKAKAVPQAAPSAPDGLEKSAKAVVAPAQPAMQEGSRRKRCRKLSKQSQLALECGAGGALPCTICHPAFCPIPRPLSHAD